MPYATAVALTRDGLDTCLTQNATYFHERVAQLDYGGIATAEEEGERIGRAVAEDVTLVLLRNHGAVTIGTDVADAWPKLYFLERACRVQVLAQATGQDLVRVPDEVAATTRDQWEADRESALTLFSAVKRQVDRENPGYER
jgi:ribulose-5-phosphate 4-epimerase/fuculose-1-phosphate aldolase